MMMDTLRRKEDYHWLRQHSPTERSSRLFHPNALRVSGGTHNIQRPSNPSSKHKQSRPEYYPETQHSAKVLRSTILHPSVQLESESVRYLNCPQPSNPSPICTPRQ